MLTACSLHDRNNPFGVLGLITYSYSLCIYKHTQTHTYIHALLDTTVYEDSFQLFSNTATLESGHRFFSVLGHLVKLE